MLKPKLQTWSFTLALPLTLLFSNACANEAAEEVPTNSSIKQTNSYAAGACLRISAIRPDDTSATTVFATVVQTVDDNRGGSCQLDVNQRPTGQVLYQTTRSYEVHVDGGGTWNWKIPTSAATIQGTATASNCANNSTQPRGMDYDLQMYRQQEAPTFCYE